MEKGQAQSFFNTAVFWVVVLALFAIVAWFLRQREPLLSQEALNAALVESVKTNSIAGAAQHLQNGADPNVIEEDPFFSNPILRTAVMNNNVEIVELLLLHGADPNAEDSKGDQILWRAVSTDNPELVALLLDAGADVHAINSEASAVLPIAVQKGNLEIVLMLLEAGASANGVAHHLQNGAATMEPALSFAAMNNDVGIGQLLLDYGAHISATNRIAPEELFTNLEQPIHWAAYYNNTEMIVFLLENGADVNAQDFQGVTPLYWAVDQEGLEAVELLLTRGADPNLSFLGRSTPLQIATSEDIRQLLRDAGAQE